MAVPKEKKQSRYTESEAASIITKRCKKNVLKKRENEYISNLGQ
jgi:hypothetical protein